MEENLKKSTTELLNELQHTEEFVKFYQKNEQEFWQHTLAEDLSALLSTKGLKKAAVIKAAEMSDVYAYQIFSGLRRPDRNKLLMLLIAMELNFEEIQTILKQHGYGQLYAKNEFDCVVIYGICQKYNVLAINEKLYEFGLPILE